MGARYVSTGSQNAAALTTLLALTSAATTRPRLFEIIFGSAATPADQTLRMSVDRFSASGTGTTVVPKPLNPSDPACLASAAEDHTVEPTYTVNAVMQAVDINQQATWRWVSPPDDGIALPALAANGVGLRFFAVTGGTALSQATFYHDE